MREKGIFLAVILGVIFIISLSSQAIAGGAPDSTLVKISPEIEGKNVTGIYIDPPIIYIKKNTIIVWLSGIFSKEVQIVFNEGKTCKDVTANPNFKVPGFFMDSKDCYVTSFLPYATASTLQFVDLGTYEYEVVTDDLKMKAKGKIIVTE